MLLLTAVFMLFGVITGVLYLRSERPGWLTACHACCAGAVLAQVLWLVYLGFAMDACALLAPGGVMGITGLAGIGASWWTSRQYRSPRVLVGGLAILVVLFAMGIGFLPSVTEGADRKMDWLLSLHILFSLVGIAGLCLGCAVGGLFLLRSRRLKSSAAFTIEGTSWPSLTALDDLFVRSIGMGVLFLAGGVILGVGAVPASHLASSWYADPKVNLAMAACLLYLGVWLLRRWQGFCSRVMVGLGTIGFVVVLVAFFAPRLFQRGFHVF